MKQPIYDKDGKQIIQRTAEPVPIKPVAPGSGNIHLDIQVSGTPFENPTPDDLRIRISEITPDGPVILVYKYTSREVPHHDEMLSFFIMRCLIKLKTEFNVDEIYHVRVKIMDMAKVANVLN